jgi:DNA-binding MarR family transcriptional regulator
MNEELQSIIDVFNKILHIYSIIDKKPKDCGTGDLLYVSEIHTIYFIGKNPEINLTQLAEMSGVTKGAVSQIVKRLVAKRYITRHKTRNKKEVNLSLSDKGYIVFRGSQSFNNEMLQFAEELYNNASAKDRDMIKRLFEIIFDNMKQIQDKYIKN